jgi:signal transduction histidine kinase
MVGYISTAAGLRVAREAALVVGLVTLVVLGTLEAQHHQVIGIHAGRGILGMRERARSAGGTVTIGPGPSGGFAVRVTLPLGGSLP